MLFQAKPVRGRKAGHESDWNCEEDDVSQSEQPNEKQLEDPQSPETSPELLVNYLLHSSMTWTLVASAPEEVVPLPLQQVHGRQEYDKF